MCVDRIVPREGVFMPFTHAVTAVRLIDVIARIFDTYMSDCSVRDDDGCTTRFLD